MNQRPIRKKSLTIKSLIIGIAIDDPISVNTNSEDFILMDCTDWSIQRKTHYEKENENFVFLRQKLRNDRLSRLNFPLLKIKKLVETHLAYAAHEKNTRDAASKIKSDYRMLRIHISPKLTYHHISEIT